MRFKTLIIFGLLFSLQGFASEKCHRLIQKYFNKSMDVRLGLRDTLDQKKFKSLGMEFEGVVVQNLTYFQISEQVQKALKDLGLDAQIKEIGEFNDHYEIQYYSGGELKKVSVLTDGSLISTTLGYPVEITSPIMRNTTEVWQYLSLIQMLGRRIDLRAEEDFGGIHVHYGAKDLTTEQLSHILKVFYVAEHKIIEKFEVKETRQISQMNNVPNAIHILSTHYKKGTLVKDIFDEVPLDRTLIAYKPETMTIELRIFNSNFLSDEHFANIDFSVNLLDDLLKNKDNIEDVSKEYREAALEKGFDFSSLSKGYHINQDIEESYQAQDPYLAQFMALKNGEEDK
ncbi:amidoligase family protein [Halobacteriovorax sp. GB3]|uniref:amidoligase family protein n=1 Tax=Halobacteriovorax sp. GB3 TaxID=2719615 RepID=UPI002360DA69|nr:amidoligase family protein [Halobacteriovorax sp. GB3]MDD0853402.1 amidoligase family protein [Halobacteriovorax sp. GB3]